MVLLSLFLVLLVLDLSTSFQPVLLPARVDSKSRLSVATERTIADQVASNPYFQQRKRAYVKGSITAVDFLGSLERVAKETRTDLKTNVDISMQDLPEAKKIQLQNAYQPRGAMGGHHSSGKYIFIDSGGRISSGQTRILDCVQKDGGPPLKAKISPRIGTCALTREAGNLRRFRGSPYFVDFQDFHPHYNLKGDSALIMQAGTIDLLRLVESSGPIRGEELRKLVANMAHAAKAIHKAKLVWSDLKLENFVLVNGKARAIDLGSVVAIGCKCLDFSPAVVPPEAASAFARGGPSAYVANEAYDIWSLGMCMLHLYLGRSYFDSLPDSVIMGTLSSPDFMVDLSEVEDKKARQLLESLLNPDPQRRLQDFSRPSWYLRTL